MSLFLNPWKTRDWIENWRNWHYFVISFCPFHHFPQDCLFHHQHPHSSTIFHICHISPQIGKIFWLNSSPAPKMYNFPPKSDWISNVSSSNQQRPPEESHCRSRAKGAILNQRLIRQVIGIFYYKRKSWSYIKYCSYAGCGEQKSCIFTNWHCHPLDGERGCEVGRFFLSFWFLVFLSFCFSFSLFFVFLW